MMCLRDGLQITYARYLTSSYLASHSAEYAPFVPEGRSIDEFRRSEVSCDNTRNASRHTSSSRGACRWDTIVSSHLVACAFGSFVLSLCCGCRWSP